MVNNLAAIALFSNFKLTTSSGKHLENINHADIISLNYKLLTSSRGSDGLSIRFDRDRNGRKRELTKNKNIKGKYHIKFISKTTLNSLNTKKKLLTDSVTN